LGGQTCKSGGFAGGELSCKKDCTLDTSRCYKTAVSGALACVALWDKTGGPYGVIGTVEVKDGCSLTVKPGVIVYFTGKYGLIVKGTLVARGDTKDQVLFTSLKQNPTPGDWGGISFASSAVASKLDASGNYVSGSIIERCTLEYAGPAVSSEKTSLFISSCVIRKNKNTTVVSGHVMGGGIYCNQGVFKKNTLSQNAAMTKLGRGGAIYSDTGTILENTIKGNSASQGSAVWGQKAVIKGNKITKNKGSWTVVTSSDIENNEISENTGDGIGAWDTTTVKHNTISKNTGWGIYCLFQSNSPGLVSYNVTSQ